VLPIGGLKEKVLAAHRGGITRVLLPRENEKDIREIPRRVRQKMELVLVDSADEVLRQALRLEHPEEFLRPRPVRLSEPAGEGASPNA
jgi:ATP-dependent Lon protease